MAGSRPDGPAPALSYRLFRPLTLGLVLAGGLARRMGGGDKGAHLLAGRPVLAHVLDRLAPQVARLAISGNGDPERFAAYAAPVVADDLPGHPGPLAGVLAGLDWAATHGLADMVSVPVDAPFLPADLVARLRAAQGGVAVVCAASSGRVHPVVALWPVALRVRLRAALLAGLRKVGAFAEGAAVVEWPADPRDPFFNVNTPEDLAEAERLIAS